MRWRKSWIDENLDGSIRMDLSPAERSVWSDLLDLCGKCRRWGYIERSQGIPWAIEALAARFVTPAEIVQSCIDKCIKEGRLSQDGTGSLIVTHWDRYQALKHESENSTIPSSQIPLSPEDKEAGQQAAAARLGYLQPGAAGRGIKHREVDEEVKKLSKGLPE